MPNFRWLRRLRVWWIKTWRRIATARGSAHSIALGLSIGVFVAMTPTIGLQMIIGIALATILGANRLAAALPAWITNPVTIPPIFYFNYSVGIFLMGAQANEEVKNQITNVLNVDGMWAKFESLLNLGMEIFLPLLIGGFVVGLICAAPVYPLSKKAIEGFRKKRLERKTSWTKIIKKGEMKKKKQEAKLNKDPF